ncbi:hypothetical protein FCV25MIE_04503 [Fagus crenata]
MSTTFLMALLLLVLLNPPLLVMTRMNSMSRIAVAMKPLESNPPSYVTLKPKTSHGGFRKRSVNSCLPKGFHHSSAPSRYVNYHTFGSTMCSSGKRIKARP